MSDIRHNPIWRLGLPMLVAVTGVASLAFRGWFVTPGFAMFPLAAFFALVTSDWLRGRLHSYNMAILPTEVAFVFGFFLMSPADLVGGIGLATGLNFLMNVRRAPARASVNGLLSVGFASITAVTFHAIGFTSIRDPRAWIAAVAMTMIVEVASAGVIAVDVRIRSGLWQVNLREALRTGLPLSAANTSLGLVAIVLFDVSAFAPLLLVPGVITLAKAYRAYLGRTDDSRRIALMNVVSTLSPSLEETVDRPQILGLVASVTNADYVDLVIPALDPPRVTWQFGVVSPLPSVGSPPSSSTVESLTPDALSQITVQMGQPWRSGMRVRLEDGKMVRGWISIGRGTDSNPAPFDELDQRMFALLAGAVAGFISRGMLISAVAERDEQATHLRYRASHDGLTKALAGHEFRTELSQALHSPDHNEKVLFFIDLDGFKPINDRYGHAAGDAVLVEIATRLRLAVRSHDLVGRMGGDEFAVLASFDGRPQIDLIAQRLLDAIREPITYLDERLMVSASIGVATLGTAEANEMLMSADAAMYQAKSAGGGGWRHASPLATTVTA